MKNVASNILTLTLMPEKEIRESIPLDDSRIMAAVCFGKSTSDPLPFGCLQFNVDLPQLGEESLVEVWSSDIPNKVGYDGGIDYSINSDSVIGKIQIQETQEDRLQHITFQAYREILDFVDRMGFPFLVRFWNYLPDINQEVHGCERYKIFCTGRHHAFSQKYNQMHKYLPASTAVGTQGGPLTIAFLAARTPDGQHLENPRQISAYKYPKHYGLQSPSFARATSKEWEGKKYLYVAGTASIVGHQSTYLNNPLGQLEETIRNIETLFENERLRFKNEVPKIKFEDALMLKTYIRDKKTYSLIRSKMEEKSINPDSNLYLMGDICRKDLLLEIEGVWLINDPLDFLEKNKPDMKPEKSKKIRV